MFLVKSRHFGLPLVQTIRPNWQSKLLVRGPLAVTVHVHNTAAPTSCGGRVANRRSIIVTDFKCERPGGIGASLGAEATGR